MRIFKTKWLARYARRAGITDRSLAEAIARAGRGLVDADLGGGIIKQRIARSGAGRSGGYRMLVAYRAGARAVFLYAFAKNQQDNIGRDELVSLREIGAAWLAADNRGLDRAMDEGILQEVIDEESR